VVQADQWAALARRGKQLHFAHAVAHLNQFAERDADA
jgi:hypothetical protein